MKSAINEIKSKEYTEKEAKEFIDNLKESFLELIKVYESLGIDIKDKIPRVFRDIESTEVRVIYSFPSNQYLFIFESGRGPSFKFHFEKQIKNIVPFLSMEGMASEATFMNINFSFSGKKITLEYALLISEDRFNERNNNTLKLANEIISTSLDYHRYNAEVDEGKKNKESYIKYLEEIAKEFSALINNSTVGELMIDKFLEKNPVILTEGLRVSNLIHQSILKNVLSKYAHDLKPDLIAFDVSEKQWAIIDYKKADKSLIKNIEKTRTGLKAEVHSLKDQLNDYVEYFEEQEHRKEFEKNYNLYIKHPIGIGIIGKVEHELQDDFNRVLKNEPRWFKIVPYNYLYDNFVDYIEAGRKFIQE